mmetsp:Transcript_36924/g.88323  ORF Transcript_36924/g.88323 Transcript_36924/m.88323 type:complete len:395 (+) Transcript_36924:151-1335(+)
MIAIDSLAQQARALWSTPYSSQFAFPTWVANEWAQIHQTFGPTAKIYHSSPDNLPEVRTLAIFREPTNIAMDRCGSRETLDKFYQKTIFGFRSSENTEDEDRSGGGLFSNLFPEGKFSNDKGRDAEISSYYEFKSEDSSCSSDDPARFRKNLEGAYRFTNESYLMPQIAAYAKTPMRYEIGGTLYSNEEGVHTLSLVGSGFDAWQQPDCAYYFDKSTQTIRGDRKEEFFRQRQISFAIVLQCCHDHGLDRIEFVAVGAGAFSALLPPGIVVEYLKSAWASEKIQDLKSSLESIGGREIHLSFRTEPPFSHCVGIGGGVPSWYRESGYTAQGQADSWEDAMERTLFINAWDPWSLVGNGNENDHSVDGFYGRQSALSLLAWPITNSFIQYRKVDF